MTTYGRNIISDASCDLTDGSDMPSTDPLLDALDAYDSTLMTMPPLPGSPAIDGAMVGDPVTIDQRGMGRFDGDQDGIIKSDIGAHEVVILLPPADHETMKSFMNNEYAVVSNREIE